MCTKIRRLPGVAACVGALVVCLAMACVTAAFADVTHGRAPLTKAWRYPYLGAIAMDCATGSVLFEDGADNVGFPASMVKMMDLLIILGRVEQGSLKLDEEVIASADASRMGGTQVFLRDGEHATLDNLLFALMIQSANDAAVTLAEHVAGSTTAFVDLMNQKAAELGMKHTQFHSVHGLPPGNGQSPDQSTPRDMARLALEIARHPLTFRYTSVRERDFRDNPRFVMKSHNALLFSMQGCDGLKTGYIEAGGYSMASSAVRNGRRVIVVTMGTMDKLGRPGPASRAVRDQNATRIMQAAFAKLPPAPAGWTLVTALPDPSVAASASPAAAGLPGSATPPMPGLRTVALDPASQAPSGPGSWEAAASAARAQDHTASDTPGEPAPEPTRPGIGWIILLCISGMALAVGGLAVFFIKVARPTRVMPNQNLDLSNKRRG